MMISSTNRVPSPAVLNNRGVCLLEAGRFADAAMCFKSASKMVIALMDYKKKKKQEQTGCKTTRQQSTTTVLQQEYSCSTTATASATKTPEAITSSNSPTFGASQLASGTTTWSDPSASQHSSLANSSFSNQAKQNEKRNDQEVEPAAKRQRRTQTCPTSMECLADAAASCSRANSRRKQQQDQQPQARLHNFGRPLWIQTQRQQKTALETSVFSATLLYNLGLCFNLSAVTRHAREINAVDQSFAHSQTVETYKRSLQFYEMALSILHPTRKEKPRSRGELWSPVLAVTLQNMTLIYTSLDKIQMATKYRDQLASLLRMKTTITVSTDAMHNTKEYENFLLRLLTLPKATTRAAAA